MEVTICNFRKRSGSNPPDTAYYLDAVLFSRMVSFNLMKSKVLPLGASILSLLSSPYSIAQELQQVGINSSGYIAYSESGRYIPFRWHDGTNMTARDAQSVSLGNGSYAVVAVGGDGTLLYRVGPLTREFLNGSAGWFTWVKSEKEPRMRAQAVRSLSTLRNGDLRIVVVGGDGRECTLDSAPRRLSQTLRENWDCL